MDERRWRHWHHHLLGGVVFRDPSRPVALPVHYWSWVDSAGGTARWLGVGGRLEGGCRSHVEASEVMLVARGCHMGVGFGCLQRTAAAGVV
jgi:hypothetical protein